MDEFLELESELTEMETVTDFNNFSYDKFIVLDRREIANFIRIVEPLTKLSVDDYGKSVLFRCISDSQVQLVYCNNPYKVSTLISNKSGKSIKTFCTLVSTLKKLVTNSYSSLIFVEENDEINIALCDSLLYLDTKKLYEEQFAFTEEQTDSILNRELSSYTFKKIGASLSLTERAAEKTIVIKDSYVWFNTGVFVSKSVSPFDTTQSFVLYKQVADIISTISEISKTDILFNLYDDHIALKYNDTYIEAPVGSEDKVKQFMSPQLNMLLSFDANISIINDSLLRIVSVVDSLEYLSDIVTLSFTKDHLDFIITSVNQSKKSVYQFNFIEGTPSTIGEIKMTTEVLKLFLSIVGTDVLYSFNESGLGIKTDKGIFLIRMA